MTQGPIEKSAGQLFEKLKSRVFTLKWQPLLMAGAVALIALVASELTFFLLRTKGWTTYTPANSGLVSNKVWALAIDEQGRAWIGGDRGLRVLAPDGSWTTYTPANSELADDGVTSLAIDGQGRAWVGTHSGVSVLAPDGSWTTYNSANSELAGDSVTSLAIDGQGQVWVGTYSGLDVVTPRGTLIGSASAD